MGIEVNQRCFKTNREHECLCPIFSEPLHVVVLLDFFAPYILNDLTVFFKALAQFRNLVKTQIDFSCNFFFFFFKDCVKIVVLFYLSQLICID